MIDLKPEDLSPSLSLWNSKNWAGYVFQSTTSNFKKEKIDESSSLEASNDLDHLAP